MVKNLIDSIPWERRAVRLILINLGVPEGFRRLTRLNRLLKRLFRRGDRIDIAVHEGARGIVTIDLSVFNLVLISWQGNTTRHTLREVTGDRQ